MFTPNEYWDLMIQKFESMGATITLEELIVDYAGIPKKRMDEWRSLNIPNKTYRERIRKAMEEFVGQHSSIDGAA